MSMKQLKTGLYGLLISLVVAPGLSTAADYAREKRWSEEVLAGLVIGEPIYLTQKNNHQFLGLYTKTENPRVAAILVHGMGVHPDWGITGVLRQRLSDKGITTLSIQMPVLAADASYKDYPQLFPEAVERLQLGVDYLRKQGYQFISIVSHSNGSRMSRVYMASNPEFVNAWVAMSLTQGDDFSGIKVPVLDIYAENDLPHVLNSVTRRKASLINDVSEQTVIADTDHFFNGQEEKTLAAIQAFLHCFE